MTACPRCHGARRFYFEVPGVGVSSGSCKGCMGTGQVDDGFPRRLTEGREIAMARTHRGYSTLRAAVAVGIEQEDLHAIEMGYKQAPADLYEKVLALSPIVNRAAPAV